MTPKSRSYQISATPVTLLVHLIVITVATLVLVWLLKFREGIAFDSSNKQKIFNIHPLLMIIGFVLIGGEAIIAYKTIPAVTNTQKAIHLILYFIALGAGILGVCVVFKYHHERGISDMYSLHSWLGMITICLFGLQWLFGFFSFILPGAEKSARGNYMPWHFFGGIVIFFFAIVTAETGLIERFTFLGLWRSQEAFIVNFIGLLIMLFAVGVGLSVMLPRVH